MPTETPHPEDLQSQLQYLRQENEAFRHNEKLFHALVETAVSHIGLDFCEKIVSKLSEWLHAECVIIGFMTDENTVEGFPMYFEGKIINGFTYSLKDTPCDVTFRKGYCVYPEKVYELFPNAKDIIELNIEGYVGTALYNKQGDTNGILCAMSRKKLDLPPQAADIMRIVGERITAEIERLKAQKALEMSEFNLRSANAAKDRLFSIIGHDLKSPFNSLIGFSKVLVDHVRKQRYDKVGQYAQIIHEVSTQTFTLLSNLLEWSVIQSKSIAFEPKPLNLYLLFNDIINFHRNQAVQKNILLTSTISSDMEICADINMLTIIVRNLVSNALKYTSFGGNITLTAIDEDHQTTIIVSDNGIGISVEDVAKLFRIESSFSTVGTNHEKGTGLGLILCKDLVEKHQGKIWVDSKPGIGSKFHFTVAKSVG